MKTFRELALEALAESGLSVAEAARRANVKYDVLRDLKRRPNSEPTVENARKIADALGFRIPAATGFAESGPQPRIDVGAALDRAASESAALPEGQHGAIKIAIVGDTIQVFATVDDQGFDELIKRLQIARQMIAT